MARRRTRTERERFAREALAMSLELQERIGVEADDIASMSLDEILSLLSANGVDLDLEDLEADARQTVGASNLLTFDRAADAGGLTDAQAEAIAARIDKALVRTTERTVRDTMRGVRDEAMFGADERPWDEQFYIWISVGEGSCPDCFDRHGTVFAKDMWADIGEPGDGRTFCGKHCRCRLFPTDTYLKSDITRDQEGFRLASTRGDMDG
jgi:hypothetical protein